MQPRALPVVTVLVAGLAVPPSAAGAPDPGPEFRAVGPAGGSVSAFAFGADGRIFSGSRGSGVFSSDNGGNTWVRRGDGLPPDVSVSHVEAWPGSRVVYLSTWADGAYRSTDNGTTWRRITQVATVDDVAFHPSDPDTVFLASSGNGLLRSTDAGESWTTLTEPNGQPVRAEAIEIAPSRPDTVYLVDVTLRRSTDGGDTWTGLGPSYTIVEDVEVDPSDPDTVYASDLSEGVQRTTDGGAHWSRLDLPEYGMDGIAVDPTDPDTVWVGTWADGTVYRSSDGGSSWAQLLVPGARHATPVVRVGPDGRSWVGAENRGPLVSADDGASWRLRRTGFLGLASPHSWPRPRGWCWRAPSATGSSGPPTAGRRGARPGSAAGASVRWSPSPAVPRWWSPGPTAARSAPPTGVPPGIGSRPSRPPTWSSPPVSRRMPTPCSPAAGPSPTTVAARGSGVACHWGSTAPPRSWCTRRDRGGSG